MDIQILRRAFLGGYRKKDVRSYIDELNKALNEKQTQYELRQAQWSMEKNELQERLDALQQSLEAEQAGSAETQQKLSQSEQEKNSLNKQLEEQLERSKELQAQLDAHLADAAKVNAKFNAYQLKSDKYDQLNDQIGDIVLNAHTYANQVIESAKQEAAALAVDSLENMSQLSKQVSGIHQEINEVGGKVGNYVQQMNQLLTQLTGEIEMAVNKIKPARKSGASEVSAQPERETREPAFFGSQSDDDSVNNKKWKIKVKLDEFPAGRMEDSGDGQSPSVLS